MSGLLSGLGSFAGGLSQGIGQGQGLQARQLQIDAERQRQKDEAALRADTQAANDAMAAKMQGFKDAYSQQQPSAQRQYLTLGGSDGSMATEDQPGSDTPVAAASPFQPSTQQLMEAAKARTDKLFALGRHDQAVNQWAKDEGLRAQLRKQAVADGMTAFKATGDVRPLLTGVYKTLDDGFSAGGIEPINNPDPKAPRQWAVERINDRTGEKVVDRVDENKLDDLVQFAIDPVKAAQYSLMTKLAGYKGEDVRKTNAEKAGQRMTLEEKKAETQQTIQQMKLDGAVTIQEMRADAAAKRTLAGGGGANGVAKTIPLEDGRQVIVFRNGDRKILVDDEGAPMIGLDYQKLINNVAKTVGSSMDGMTDTPEANHDRATKIVPRPPAAPKKPRLTLGDVPGAAQDFSHLWSR